MYSDSDSMQVPDFDQRCSAERYEHESLAKADEATAEKQKRYFVTGFFFYLKVPFKWCPRSLAIARYAPKFYAPHSIFIRLIQFDRWVHHASPYEVSETMHF